MNELDELPGTELLAAVQSDRVSVAEIAESCLHGSMSASPWSGPSLTMTQSRSGGQLKPSTGTGQRHHCVASLSESWTWSTPRTSHQSSVHASTLGADLQRMLQSCDTCGPQAPSSWERQ